MEQRSIASARRGALLAWGLALVLWAAPDALASPSAAPPLAPAAERADRVVVHKAARRLRLMRGGEILAEYHVALGFEPDGHKRRQGDGRTPEGTYRITWRNPNSAFHLSLFINYPSAADRAAAVALGVDPGGDIFVHGGNREPSWLGWIVRLFRGNDWTAGCIAVTNREMEEIWALVPNGAPIEILP